MSEEEPKTDPGGHDPEKALTDELETVLGRLLEAHERNEDARLESALKKALAPLAKTLEHSLIEMRAANKHIAAVAIDLERHKHWTDEQIQEIKHRLDELERPPGAEPH